MKDTVVTR